MQNPETDVMVYMFKVYVIGPCRMTKDEEKHKKSGKPLDILFYIPLMKPFYKLKAKYFGRRQKSEQPSFRTAQI